MHRIPSRKCLGLPLHLVVTVFCLLPLCTAQVFNFYQIAGKSTSHPTGSSSALLTDAPATVKWVQRSNGEKHSGAVVAGLDAHRRVLYAVRYDFDGQVIPGKLSEEYGLAYFPYGTEEVERENYELLVAPIGAVSWVESDGRIPTYAIKAGKDNRGNVLYIGRVEFEGTVTNGFIGNSGDATFSYGGQVYSRKKCEILVLNSFGRALIYGSRNATTEEARFPRSNGTFAIPEGMASFH